VKIAVLGTRGIPNLYGGFEECAERLSSYWRSKGHEVTVYTPHWHPYQGEDFRGVFRRRLFCPEKWFGPWGTLIYDLLSLLDASRRDFEVILNLGYVPAGVFFPCFSRGKALFLTNMDGLEWKRAKWSPLQRRYARLCEKAAVRASDHLIADNPGIREYLRQTYAVKEQKVSYIPYGAEIPPTRPELLQEFHLRPYEYFLVVARLEPENNLLPILEGYLSAGCRRPFLVVGNLNTPYAAYLKRRFGLAERVHFLGGIYERRLLATLRAFSRLHFHGHSVGGTNPSLLEAMAAGALICAHDNVFNRYVLGEEGFYFRTAADVAHLLKKEKLSFLREKFARRNQEKIKSHFNWSLVAEQYLLLFEKLLRH